MDRDQATREEIDEWNSIVSHSQDEHKKSVDEVVVKVLRDNGINIPEDFTVEQFQAYGIVFDFHSEIIGEFTNMYVKSKLVLKCTEEKKIDETTDNIVYIFKYKKY